MFKEFVIYYFFHNDSIVLPALMVYMLMGTSAGLLIVIGEWFMDRIFGTSELDMQYVPNFFRFVAFWIPWLMFGFLEFICKKWFPRFYWFAFYLNEKLSNWMLRNYRTGYL